jgi:hypothetical protein
VATPHRDLGGRARARPAMIEIDLSDREREVVKS